MQTAEAYIGTGQSVEVRIDEKETRQMHEVLSRSLPSFYRKAYRQLGNAADAEDAVQDALLSAYKHLDQFKGQAQMSTWLTAIVINSARMQLRRRPRQIHLSPTSDLARSKNIRCQKNCRTGGRALKMSVEGRNCAGVFYNS